MTTKFSSQQAAASRKTPNVISQQRLAIIFVPGIMGSRIQLSDDIAWDPDSKSNMLRWGSRFTTTKRRILNSEIAGTIFQQPSNEFPETEHADRVVRGFGGVRWASYGTFLEYIEGLKFGSHQTPVYVYGYDWRQPVIQLGVQLAADILGDRVTQDGNQADPNANRYGGKGILAHAGAQNCIIITHSMGGLVSRSALKSSSVLQEKTSAVLHGVQPVTGAPTMNRRLITGMFSPVDGGSAVADKVLRSILGTSGDETGQIASVLPGAFQLLPSNVYRQDADSQGVSMLSWSNFNESHLKLHRLTTDVYDGYRRPHNLGPTGLMRPSLPLNVRNDLTRRILELERYHNFIQRWKLPNKTWAFFGDGVNSDSTVHFNLPPSTITEEKRFLRSSIYTATDPSGNTVQLDHETDIVRNGFSQTVIGQTASKSNQWGYGPFGDGTVARISGAALFDDTETALSSEIPWDFGLHKQFAFDDLEHEAAYRDLTVQQFCRSWIRHALSLFTEQKTTD